LAGLFEIEVGCRVRYVSNDERAKRFVSVGEPLEFDDSIPVFGDRLGNEIVPTSAMPPSSHAAYRRNWRRKSVRVLGLSIF
jgi:hypothetical protein